MFIVSYRSNYKSTTNKTSGLKAELQNLQRELSNLQENRPVRRQNNYFEYDQLINNKLLLIGGCILIGVGLAYLLFNPNKRGRC